MLHYLKRRKILAIACSGIALFLTCAWLKLRPLPFNADQWQQAEFLTSDIRYRMHKSALQMVKTGQIQSADDALRVFGKSEMGESISEPWMYYLRPNRPIPIDSIWLVLKFDPNGKIVDCHLQTD